MLLVAAILEITEAIQDRLTDLHLLEVILLLQETLEVTLQEIIQAQEVVIQEVQGDNLNMNT